MQVMNDDISPTLREQMKHHEPIVCYSVGADLTWQGCSGLTQTATTLDTAARTLSKSQPKTCAIIEVLGNEMVGHHEPIAYYTEEPITLDVFHLTSMKNGAQILKARDYKDPQIVCCAISTYGSK